MLPRQLTKSLTAANATNILTPTTLGAAGNFTLNGTTVSGGVATLDSQRRVLLTFAANETGHNFTITGTNDSGAPVSEVIAGTTAGTVVSVNDYKTVTSIAASAATTGNVSAGTNNTAAGTIGSSPWQLANQGATPIDIEFVCYFAAGTCQIEYTLDPIQNIFGGGSGLLGGIAGPGGPILPAPNLAGAQPMPNGQMVGLNVPVTAFRLSVLSGTGPFTLQWIESGIASP